MQTKTGRQRRLTLGGIFVVAGIVVLVAGSVIPGIILIVAGLIILALAARGYETLNDAAHGRAAHGPDGSNIKQR